MAPGCLIANLVPHLAALDGETAMLVREFRRRIRRGFARALRADRVPHAERRAHLLGALLWGTSTEIRWDGSARTLTPLDEGLGRQVDQRQPEGHQR